MALLQSLPLPRHFTGNVKPYASGISAAPKKQPPVYGQRKGFVPRGVEDFGDGGAFPEIHVAQYPLDMGNKRGNSAKSTVGMSVNEDGSANYGAIVTHKSRQDVITQHKYQDLLPKAPGQEGSLERPDDEDLAAIKKKTREAFATIVEGKMTSAMPTHIAKQEMKDQYIRYTPAQTNPNHASGSSQRIIHMVEAPKDPFEPPQFQHKRVPAGPPSPPVPVMHSPTRKVSVKDQQAWKIPPCISNWKNSKGYTIPLDKRLAADGRDTQEHTINDKFAKLSESLYVAERVARDDISKRADSMKKLAIKKSEEKDAQLRRLAARVIEEKQSMAEDDDEEDGDTAGRGQRDALREDRKRERERDYRIAMAAPEKRSKLMRDKERDVSEQIALGQATTTGNKELEYDHRLYNQSEGLGQGFGDAESYNTYDKPLFKGQGASKNYAARSTGDDFDTDAFVENVQGKGGEQKGRATGGGRAQPVAFEKEADPFGLDEFLDQTKKGGGRR